MVGGERCSQLSEFLTKWLLNQAGPWCPPSFMTARTEPSRCQSGNCVHIYNWISYISYVRSQLVFKTELKNLFNYLKKKKIVRKFQWQIVRLWTHLYAKSYYSWIFSLNFQKPDPLTFFQNRKWQSMLSFALGKGGMVHFLRVLWHCYTKSAFSFIIQQVLDMLVSKAIKPLEKGLWDNWENGQPVLKR